MNRRIYTRDDFDDYAQVDGDASAAVAFVPNAAAPWLREGVPPWHMWGNSQTLRVNAETTDTPAPVSSGQLVKVSYKRPETWHFLLSARIINAPEVTLENELAITVFFDVISGVGRSQSQLLTFETFSWGWVQNQPPPYSKVLWTQQVQTPALRMVFDSDSGEYVDDPNSVRVFNELVGQDVQVNCRVAFFMRGINEGDQSFADVEVSAYFAPKTHVRPDWFVQGPPEVMFPGAETQGK